MRPHRVVVSLAFGCAAATRAAGAQDVAAARPAVRIETVAGDIRMDGRLDDSAWSAADSIVSLAQVEPREGAPPTARTVVRVLATAGAIVIGLRADDPDPARIVSYARQRDATLDSEDHITIVLDTYLDGRSGYVFSVNPDGARYDALVAGQGEGENASWDAVWDAATARGDSGWSAEIRIPLKSLLFRPGLSEWGFNVERRIQRLQETDRWAGPRRNYHVTHTSHAGLLVGLPRFDLGLGLTVRPSVLAGGGRDSAGAALRSRGSASLDVTQRIGANTLMSLTANTDFAETEVDARQVNLTRFPSSSPRSEPSSSKARTSSISASALRTISTSFPSSAAASGCLAASRCRSGLAAKSTAVCAAPILARSSYARAIRTRSPPRARWRWSA